MKKTLFTAITMLSVLVMANPSFAQMTSPPNLPSGFGEQTPCSHPVFITHECYAETGGNDGQDGQDGIDGIDGIDGQDGIDGINGIDGVDGTNGIDGVDGIDGRNGIDGRDGRDGRDAPRTWYREMNEYIAATNAVTAHLPRYGESSRLTFGAARAHGVTGVGVAYSIQLDEVAFFTLKVARAGDSKVGGAEFSVGF